MATRTLDSPPSILPLYARAAAPMIPGASLLPFLPGGGGEIPELELDADGVQAEPDARRRLRQGLRLRPARPPAPHLPARARLPAAHGGDGRRQLPVRRGRPRPPREPDRPAPADRRRARSSTLRVRADHARAAPEGPHVHASSPRPGSATSWSGRATSTMLRRGGGEPRRRRPRRAHAVGRRDSAEDARGQRRVAARRRPRPPLRRRLRRPQPDPHARADREAARLPARDRPRDVDQGALPGGAREPPARRLRRRGRFRKPILLPGTGRVRQPPPRARRSRFAVRDAKKQTPHLDGRAQPLEPKAKTGRNQ